VQFTERFCDDSVSAAEWLEVGQEARVVVGEARDSPAAVLHAAQAAAYTAARFDRLDEADNGNQDALDAAEAATRSCAELAAHHVHAGADDRHALRDYLDAFTAQRTTQADLLRHVTGNPFRPYLFPAQPKQRRLMPTA
jgi:hypothetical protein